MLNECQGLNFHSSEILLLNFFFMLWQPLYSPPTCGSIENLWSLKRKCWLCFGILFPMMSTVESEINIFTQNYLEIHGSTSLGHIVVPIKYTVQPNLLQCICFGMGFSWDYFFVQILKFCWKPQGFGGGVDFLPNLIKPAVTSGSTSWWFWDKRKFKSMILIIECQRLNFQASLTNSPSEFV